MQWKLERPAGATALLLAVGMFLTTAAPMAAAQLDPPAEEPAVQADPVETAEPASSLPASVAMTEVEIAAAAEPAVQLEPVRFVVRTPELTPGTQLTLANADGAVGTLPAPDGGQTTLTLQPGRWTISADGWQASFTLRENASVADAEGACWTDGETLTLSQAVHGTLTVSKTFTAQEETAFVYRLVGGEVENDCRVLLFAPETGTVQACSFWGIPAGSYTLLENDVPVGTVTVTNDAREHTLTLS